jgi:hypothetical protein
MSDEPNYPRVTIYASGICAMSVCALADATVEEIEAHANRETPTGIDSRWKIGTDATFADGTPHPGPCNLGGEKRKHHLLHC